MAVVTLEEIRRVDAARLASAKAYPNGMAHSTTKAEIDILDLLWDRFPDDGPAIMVVLDCILPRAIERLVKLGMIGMTRAEFYRAATDLWSMMADRAEAKAEAAARAPRVESE